MTDHGFANTLLKMNNELPAEPNVRYLPSVNNAWSRLFGIQQLPFAAHSRAVDHKLRLKEAKEDARLRRAELRAQETKDDEAADGMYLPTLTLPLRHFESTGLHPAPTQTTCSMTLEVGTRESPLALTHLVLLVCRRFVFIKLQLEATTLEATPAAVAARDEDAHARKKVKNMSKEERVSMLAALQGEEDAV